MGRVAAISKDGSGWTLADGKRLSWSLAAPDRASFQHVEIIYTTGSWRHKGGADLHYLLRSTVHSPAERSVGLRFSPASVSAVFVNGLRVEQQRARLRMGPNQVLLACLGTGSFRPENAGVFFRVTPLGSPERLADIAYEAD